MRILLFDIDTLRPDHLGCYGYQRPTSPNIDKIAEDGIHFTNYHTSNPPCLPNRTAFWSGKFGINTGVINHGGVYADPEPEGITRKFTSQHYLDSLGYNIHKSGLKTATISTFASNHTAYQFLYGFEEVHDPMEGDEVQCTKIEGIAQDWLDRNGADDDWFLHVHFWDPHTPYSHPPEYLEALKDTPIDDWLTEDVINGLQGKAGWHTADTLNGWHSTVDPKWLNGGVGSVKCVDDAKVMINSYDASIRYCDEFVGKIIEKLKKLDIYEDTIIILTSDHGENLGELNSWGQHMTADQITSRVPLIIKAKGLIPEGNGERNGLHYQVDLSATILDIIGKEKPKSWDGESFKSSFPTNKKGRDYLVMDTGSHLCQRTIRWDDYILIRTYHNGTNDYPQYMLFDIVKDPHEQKNLAEERQDLVGLGMLKMDDWMGDQMFKAQRGDPMWGILREGGPFHHTYDRPVIHEYLARLKARPNMQSEYKRIITNYGVPRKNNFLK